MGLSKLFACTKCGCTDIQLRMWVEVNTRQIVPDSFDDLTAPRAYWCEQCREWQPEPPATTHTLRPLTQDIDALRHKD